MLTRATEIWNLVCKPKPTVNFKVIDLEVEKPPEDKDDSIDINIYFVT